MFHRFVLLFVAVVIMVMVSRTTGNEMKAREYELRLSKVDSRLNIGSQIIEAARQQLKNDLKELCRNGSCKNRLVNRSRGKNMHPDEKPMDCSDIYKDGYHTDGIYTIWPQSRISNGPLRVYCDMKDGGGWTVLQRRGDFGNAADYFYNGWDAYKTGFGHVSREFWIGNDNIFTLTSQRSYQLRVDLADWIGITAYATYDVFWIDDESLNYTLHVNGYNGTAGESLLLHDGKKFSTKDRDNDLSENRNCAVAYMGAWWFASCYNSHLNGLYRRISRTGILWSGFRGPLDPLKKAVMKIRPSNFEPRLNEIAEDERV